ncbi:MAG: zinc ribbon domain-containing protein [Actinomycetota bacterium]
MDVPPTTEEERRCPHCEALVAADAEWCGQCFTPLTESAPEPTPDPVPESVGDAADGARKVPTWPCPACGHDNAIEHDACAICGTPFAVLMRQDEQLPVVEPKDALAWSLVFPGLGHRKVGHGMDGLARGVLFAMLFAMALLTGLSGVRSGMVFALFAAFMALALATYLGSAFEAYQMAQGGRPLVTARTLLWVTVGVIVLSMAVLALTVVTASRR